ncbi:MAG: (d)CMP kinase [Rickettsiales bacterium]|jgi:cytidylate kinase|nr:(d)CMP kinase [Rickettsiales bacterium]
MNKIIVIDGPVAAGKGTLAKKIAAFFGMPYLNTGALYRAVGLYMLKNCTAEDITDEDKVLSMARMIDFSNLDNPDLYLEEVGAIASKVAAGQKLRSFLAKMQVDFAHQDGGAVLDGRDIGTVICPEASYKFFVTASVEERAKRRYKEMILKNESVDYNEILSSIKERDKRDSERAKSPLKKAEDAIEIDTTNMGIDEVFAHVLSFIKF